MRIIGYTYCADVHCPHCTCKAACKGLLKCDEKADCTQDEWGLAMNLTDREGNPIHPVFDIDEASESLTHCGDCREALQ